MVERNLPCLQECFIASKFIKNPTKRGVLCQSDGVGRLGNRFVFTRSCWSRRSFPMWKILTNTIGRKKSRNLRAIYALYVVKKVPIVLLIFTICDLVQKKVVTVKGTSLLGTSRPAIVTTTKSMAQGYLIDMAIQSISW